MKKFISGLLCVAMMVMVIMPVVRVMELGVGASVSAAQEFRTEPMVAAGYRHTVALHSDGTVWAWGNNSRGQLGDGTATNRSAPVQVQGLNNVIAISAGIDYTIALSNDGTVWAWGRQLGDGVTLNIRIPAQVQGLANVIAISAGSSHVIALSDDGTVWTWGNNTHGQLGDGTTTVRRIPAQVQGLNNVAAISVATNHTIALSNDGTMWTWGNNSDGQLGDGTTTNRYAPVQAQNINNVVAISAGGDTSSNSNHTIAVRNDGTVWTWGRNLFGQLGDGTRTNRSTPVKVQNLENIITISTGFAHTVAVRNDGTVWTWGRNDIHGQLGDGTTTNRSAPVQVQNINNVVAISAGTNHTIAVGNDGNVWAWGDNRDGKLGDGTTTDRHTPVQVLGPNGVGFLNLGESQLGNNQLPNIQPPTPPQQPTTSNVIRTRQGDVAFNRPLSFYLTNRLTATEFCSTIAHMAAAFSDSVYEDNYVIDSLVNHGFNRNNIRPRFGQVWQFGSPNFIIAEKYAANGDMIVAVIIRGTDTHPDLITSLNVSLHERNNIHYHYGFWFSMRNIIDSSNLRTLANHARTNREYDTHFIITGHSYGGAVANLLARELTQNYGVDNERIFTYTFAAPRVARVEFDSRPIWTDEYTNIFNIQNANDNITLFPSTPPSLWNIVFGTATNYYWYRFGRSIHFVCHDGTGLITGTFGSPHSMATYLEIMSFRREPTWFTTYLGNVSAIPPSWVNNTRVIRANSPIDIAVMDSYDNIIGTITGGEVWHDEDFFGSAILMIDEEYGKFIHMPAHEDFRIVVTATDDGSMEFEVVDANLDTGEVVSYVTFGTVPLEKGQEFVARFGELAYDTRLFILEDGEEVGEVERVVSDNELPDNPLEPGRAEEPSNNTITIIIIAGASVAVIGLVILAIIKFGKSKK